MALDLSISKNRSKSGFARLTFTNRRGENMPIVNGVPVNPSKPRPRASRGEPPPPVMYSRTNTNTNTLSRRVPNQNVPNQNAQRVNQWVAGTSGGANIYGQNQITHQNQINQIGNVGIQNQLTETTFRQYLDGFVEISPRDLPTAPGSRLRYAIDTVVGGRVVSTLYRLGGYVKSVSQDLGTVVLFNPYANKTWTLKINQPGKRVRLYLFKRPSSDEGALVRALVNKIQNGQIQIIKKY